MHGLWLLVKYTSVMLHHPRMSLHERVNRGANLIAKRPICTHADNAHMLAIQLFVKLEELLKLHGHGLSSTCQLYSRRNP